MFMERRTNKKGYHTPKSVDKKVRECHDVSCGMIEWENRKPTMTMPQPKHITRWCSGVCKICHEHMDMLTNYHASTHGYKSADEMVKDGKYAFE
jgi:hypothetical protein